MGIGIIGKALGGAGGAVKDVGMEMVRAEIMKQRDERLNQYATTMETDVRQPFQTSERVAAEAARTTEAEAGRTFTSGESQKGRDFTEAQNKPKLAGEELDNTIKQITITNAQEVQKLRTQFQKETDPSKRAIIHENIQTLTGKDTDKFLPVPLKDELGNITGYQVLNTKSGVWVEPAGGKPAAGTDGKADYSGLWGAGKKPAAAPGTPAAKSSATPSAPSDPNAFARAQTGGGAEGVIEMRTADNILTNMKATNNFTQQDPYGGRPVNKAGILADLQKAMPFAKGDKKQEIMQAIETLSGTSGTRGTD